MTHDIQTLYTLPWLLALCVGNPPVTKKRQRGGALMFYLIYARLNYRRGIWRVLVFMWRHCDVTPHIFSFCLKSPTVRCGCEGSSRHGHQENGGWPHDIWNSKDSSNKYSLLMNCIKIKSLANCFLNEQYVLMGGYISIQYLCHHVVPKRLSQLDYELNDLKLASAS